MINRISIRQASEEKESGLSPYAARSAESRGRQRDAVELLDVEDGKEVVFDRVPGPGARTFHAKTMRRLSFHGPGGPTV